VGCGGGGWGGRKGGTLEARREGREQGTEKVMFSEAKKNGGEGRSVGGAVQGFQLFSTELKSKATRKRSGPEVM